MFSLVEVLFSQVMKFISFNLFENGGFFCLNFFFKGKISTIIIERKNYVKNIKFRVSGCVVKLGRGRPRGP